MHNNMLSMIYLKRNTVFFFHLHGSEGHSTPNNIFHRQWIPTEAVDIPMNPIVWIINPSETSYHTSIRLYRQVFISCPLSVCYQGCTCYQGYTSYVGAVNVVFCSILCLWFLSCLLWKESSNSGDWQSHQYKQSEPSSLTSSHWA